MHDPKFAYFPNSLDQFPRRPSADPAFSVEVLFYQLIVFEANQTPYFMPATTWSKGGIGPASGPEHIIQCLDGLLDSFLNEYLKANTRKG